MAKPYSSRGLLYRMFFKPPKDYYKSTESVQIENTAPEPVAAVPVEMPQSIHSDESTQPSELMPEGDNPGTNVPENPAPELENTPVSQEDAQV